jgi:ATP-dependent DNA ligase
MITRLLPWIGPRYGFHPVTKDRKSDVHRSARAGFTAETARALWKQLQPLRAPESPFAERVPTLARKGVVWVRPELVAEVVYRGWTPTSSCGTPRSRGSAKTRTRARSSGSAPRNSR